MKYVQVVRGQLKADSQQEAQQAHDEILAQLPAIARPLGSIGHQAYLDPQNPKAFLAIDTWTSLEGMQKFMEDPKLAEAFGNLFEGMPEITVWNESGWISYSDE